MTARIMWLRLAGILFVCCPLVRGDEVAGRQVVRVQEVDGIRRFGYPLTVPLELPAGTLLTDEHVRLLHADGKPAAAQITATARHPDGSIRALEADLTVSPGPREVLEFAWEYGPDTTRGPVPRGLAFEETDDEFRISAYRIRKDANPLIASVVYGREYLAPGGLQVVALTEGAELTLAQAQRQWSVEKKGPVQVRLRCTGTLAAPRGAMIPFALTLEFASSKSWVGVDYQVGASGETHPWKVVTKVDLAMAGRLLWDADVGYWLYGVLEKQDRMVLTSEGLHWSCRLGAGDQPPVYAASASLGSRFLGWGHFQESRENGNVVAFGVADEPSPVARTIRLNSQGELRIEQQPAAAGTAHARCYFHFIPVPAQHTARTSPAAMMRPLQIVPAALASP
ncbi:MAG: hypothetical protein AB7F89_05305 [Pirellulaceae bacterium]